MGSTKPPLSIRENLPAPGARLTSTALATAVVAAPVVELNASMDTRRHLDPSATEVKYNPRYEAHSNVQCGVNQSLLLSDPSPIIGYACQWLTNWLTHSCLVNLIGVTLACEDANSKLVEVVTVADVDAENHVGINLLQIWDWS